MKKPQPILTAPGAIGASPPENVGEAVIRIGKAFEQLSAGSGLNRKAIVILVQDQTKLPKKTIEYVLNSLEDLKRQFCR